MSFTRELAEQTPEEFVRQHLRRTLGREGHRGRPGCTAVRSCATPAMSTPCASWALAHGFDVVILDDLGDAAPLVLLGGAP